MPYIKFPKWKLYSPNNACVVGFLLMMYITWLGPRGFAVAGRRSLGWAGGFGRRSPGLGWGWIGWLQMRWAWLGVDL